MTPADILKAIEAEPDPTLRAAMTRALRNALDEQTNPPQAESDTLARIVTEELSRNVKVTK